MAARYSPGDIVMIKSSGKKGSISKVFERDSGTRYMVFYDNQNRRFPESDLQPYIGCEDLVEDALDNGDIRNANQFLLYAYYHKLSERSDSNIYSYQGNRIIFNPFQYKPLLKFISADSDERLLIADEVGVGKTIESGIIIDELLARQELQSNDLILIVCPNILKQKWRQELSDKFGINDFYIHNGPSLRNMLQELKSRGICSTYHSIVGEQLFRNPKYVDLLNEALTQNGAPFIKMLIVDECHHYRNPNTETHKLGIALSRCSERVVMLSATPFNLREDDLFNQLKMLNEAQYPDYQLFKQLGKQIRAVNKSISYLRNDTPENNRLLQYELSILRPVAENSEYIRDEFQFLEDAIEKHSKLSSQEIVHYEKILNFLNPLSSSFTRTLKRDALAHRVTRESKTLSVHFSELEHEIYADFIDVNITRYRINGVNEKAFALITNTLERIAASSIPALADNIARYTNANSDIDSDDDYSDDDANIRKKLKDILSGQYDALKKKIDALNGADSKLDTLLHLISTVQQASPDNSRVMIFSYYVGTLKYLRKQLTQKGFKVGLMYGQTPLEPVSNKVDEDGMPLLSRYELIEAFKAGDIDILLASEVGGEGLDFQFCSILINYDLPYNPMRIEQRIGRIDRMGQKADKVIIGNLCIEGTVDEVINSVLLSRISDAADLVGDLEPIITNQLIEVNQLIITKGFSNAEIQKRVHEIELRIEEERVARKDFDEQRYELVNDSGFRDEFEVDLENSRIKPSDSLKFTLAYLKETNGCWAKELSENIASIHLSNDVKLRLRSYYNKNRFGSGERELKELAASPEYIKVAFDGDTAFENDATLFLKPCGPWVHFMIDDIRNRSDRLDGQVFHASVSHTYCNTLAKGTYSIYIFDYCFEGFQAIKLTKMNLTKYITVDCKNGRSMILDESEWDQILNHISLAKGEIPDSDTIISFKDIADATSDIDSDKLKASISGINDVKINSRIEALKRLSQVRIDSHHNELLSTSNPTKQEQLIAAINRDRSRTQAKIENLETLKVRNVSTKFNGILILDVI